MKSWFTPAKSLNAIKTQVNITPENNWNKVGQPKSGSYNTVNMFVKNFNPNNKISIRTSTDPIYIIEPKTNTIYNEFGDPVTTKEKKEALQNKSNWEQASVHKLSPKLFYYGYFKQPGFFEGTNVDKIYLCVISEGFSSDLSSYYRNPKNIVYKEPPQGWIKRVSTSSTSIETKERDSGELYWWNPLTKKKKFLEEKHRILSKTDINIANQLVNLLQKTASVMNVLCFDLKPQNCVINTTTHEVKLIDWDADWCVSFDFLKINPRSKKDKSIGKLSGLISTVFMANQFLKWSGWNIFAKYFSEKSYKKLLTSSDSFYRRPLIPSLKTLFCNRVFVSGSTKKGNKWWSGNQIMTMHYQLEAVKEADPTINRGGKEKFQKKCNKIFDVLWGKTKNLTDTIKYVPSPTPGGGGKKIRKYKTRKRKRKRGGEHSKIFKTLMKKKINKKITQKKQEKYKKIKRKIQEVENMTPAQLMRRKTIRLDPMQVESKKNIPYINGGRKYKTKKRKRRKIKKLK